MTRRAPLPACVALAALVAMPACTKPPAQPLVVLVSVDTLRADRLGVYGNADGLTPNLDRFASEGVVFERAYAAANETQYSHANLFTGKWASELATLDEGFAVPADTPTLATVLGLYGWTTAAFVAGGRLAKGHGLEAGFSVYDDTASWGSFHETVPRALRWLDTPAEGPRFLFVHGYDAHDRYLKPTPFGYAHADRDYAGPARDAIRGHGRTSLVVDGQLPGNVEDVELFTMTQPRPGRVPFTSPTGQTAALAPDDVTQIRAAYDGAVAYADAWFGELVAGLVARGLYDAATILVLSDHGEALGGSGYVHHRYTLDENTLHVPLLVKLPGGAHGGRRVSGLVELSDVMPTVLALAGATPPAGLRGASLVDVLTGAAAPTRTVTHAEGAQRLLSVADADARLVAAGLSADNPALVDLLAHTPVNDATLRVVGDPTHAEPLRDALVTWRRGIELGATYAPDPAAVEAARAHGYWGNTP